MTARGSLVIREKSSLFSVSPIMNITPANKGTMAASSELNGSLNTKATMESNMAHSGKNWLKNAID